MTTPSERTASVIAVERFLFDLVNPIKTKRVPKEIRDMAYRLLRHYPASGHIDVVASKCPEIFGRVWK